MNKTREHTIQGKQSEVPMGNEARGIAIALFVGLGLALFLLRWYEVFAPMGALILAGELLLQGINGLLIGFLAARHWYGKGGMGSRLIALLVGTVATLALQSLGFLLLSWYIPPRNTLAALAYSVLPIIAFLGGGHFGHALFHQHRLAQQVALEDEKTLPDNRP